MLAEYKAGRLPTLAGIAAVDPTHPQEEIEKELAGFGIEHNKEDTYPLSCKDIIPDFISI